MTRVEFGHDGAGRRRRDGVVAEVREPQVAKQEAAVGVRIIAHPLAPPRRELRELGSEPAAFVEEFRGTVAPHPLFQDAHMGRIPVHLAHRHLVGAPIVFCSLAIDLLRAGPALG